MDLPAHGQLTGYVGAVRRQVDGGVKVFGLLISDGTTVRLQEALIASGFGQLSLSVLGYRDHLYRQHQLTIDLDPALGTVEPVEPEKLLAGLDEGRTRSYLGRARSSSRANTPTESSPVGDTVRYDQSRIHQSAT